VKNDEFYRKSSYLDMQVKNSVVLLKGQETATSTAAKVRVAIKPVIAQ
jgi:hypothetical protein